MIVSISGKVSDMCNIQSDHKDHDGYVPQGLGIGGGDYIDFSIDTETGTIQGWTAEIARKWKGWDLKVVEEE